MKPYDPIPMVITLKPYQSIKVGEIIREVIGGKEVIFKVVSIRAAEIFNTFTTVQVMVREIGEGDAE